MYRRIALAALYGFSVGILPLNAQVFWHETFSSEGAAVSKWKNGGNNPGLADWTWTDNPAAGYQDDGLPVFAAPTATSGYFFFDSHQNGQVAHDVTLSGFGRPANCSDKTDVRLRFFTQYIYFNPEGAEAWVGVSTDSVHFTYKPLFEGLPPNLPFHDWVEVALDEADNAPKVWLRFRWIGQYEYHWKIDDLSLYRFYTPDADFCETAADISPFFDPLPGVVRTTGVFDNSDATVSATDPEVNCWGEAGPGGADILNNTLWFTFTGNGGVYELQTVPCTADPYIGEAQGNKGDTQMLVFTGEHCGDLTPVQCNDDLFLSGQPDFRAGITLETQFDQIYYLLIDGFDNQGVAATGEFCIQILRKTTVTCGEGRAGAFTLANNGYLCAGQNLFDLMTLDTASFVLPTVGPHSGLAWCFTNTVVPQNVWPGNIPGVAGTPFTGEVEAPSLLNNGQSLDYGTYYLTPVVLGGGVLTNPGSLPYIFNIDPNLGCYFTGQSSRLVLLPPLDNLTATISVTEETLPPGSNGAITLGAGGGSGASQNDPALYQYKWSNGATTRNLSGLKAGDYTVTISDASGCVAPLIQTVTVPAKTVQTEDPAVVRFLALSPNPVRDAVLLQLSLEAPAAVRVEVTDLPGQVLWSRDAGVAQQLEWRLGLEQLAAGMYVLRVNVGSEVALRQLVKI
ncbi:MAG: T9SS type A sorting domain-containing protein [Thermoanaerobaculia bacterium]|nr:T9SS type A sorting domain-containing protein [Thermoanaerobaculia bacterium]